MSDPVYTFRPVTREDLPLLRTWLRAPEVVRWWGDPDHEAQLLEEDLDNEQMAQRIVALEGRPCAYVQHYDVHAWPHDHLAHLPDGARAIDTFVGDAEMLGRGHGGRYLRQLADELFAAGAPAVAIDPDAGNARARAANARAGFELEALSQVDDAEVAVMVRGRPLALACAADPLMAALHALAPRIAAGTLDDALAHSPLADITAGKRASRVSAELIRRSRDRSKLLVSARLDAMPDVDVAAFEAAGFRASRSPGGVSLTREGEWVVVSNEGPYVSVEQHREGPFTLAVDAATSLAAIPSIALFAPLARGRARLRTHGVAHDRALGHLGLVTVDRDLARLELDEEALRAAGLHDGREDLWSTRDGAHSLVFMGGTLYGYHGPVPEDSIGGWA